MISTDVENGIDVRENVRYNDGMKIVNATKARANFYQLMREAEMDSEPITVTGKENDVVIVSKRYWEGLQETLYLYSIPGFVEGILEAEKSDEWYTLEDFRKMVEEEGGWCIR